MLKIEFNFLTISLTVLVINVNAGILDVPQSLIEGLEGETIDLPCNVSTYDSDEVVLVLWYRDDKGTPIYSVDIRDGFTRAVRRWSDSTIFGNRAYFQFDKEPGGLSIQKVKSTDSGLYRCRVDFLKAQTRNSKVKLVIIVPPTKVVILDDASVERSTVIGPYNEEDVVTLTCRAFGGTPLPHIQWFRDDAEVLPVTNHASNKDYVQSIISLGPLRRWDLNSHIVCKASNHPNITSVETIVQIDMNFSPLDIRLLGAHQPLSAGRRYDLLCQSSGSRPPAVITWWLDGIRMEKTTETTSSDGNQTTSMLSVTFTKEDINKLLTCKAYNHAVTAEAIEDGWTLDIQYVPETIVRLGTSLNANTIKEGSDVYFDCLVKSHPDVYRMEWKYNGMKLSRNISQGVIVSNHSLVLQGVTRLSAGNYTCAGFNSEGEGISKPFSLNILYAPTCSPNQTRIYGVAKQEDAKVTCSVDANPPEVNFNWTFNNSAESIDVATNHVSSNGVYSTVTYTPVTELDYGTLLCSASNKIGKQRTPCVYHIIAAGRPDQVHNCTVSNVSMTSLTVTCSEGFNGGLPQLFLLEVHDSYSNEVKLNATSTLPRFTVSTLLPGGIYILSIYAYNSKGRSDPVVVTGAMQRLPAKQLTSEPESKWKSRFSVTPVISLAVGLTSIILVAFLAIILTLRVPCRTHMHAKSYTNHPSLNCSPGSSEKGSSEFEINEEERNPDVVPEPIDVEDESDHINNRLYVSTIDATCNPCRVTLSTNAGHDNYASRIILHSTHKVGYRTVGNIPHSSESDNMQLEMAPKLYSNSVSQYSLPRHTTQQMWPNCNNLFIGVKEYEANRSNVVSDACTNVIFSTSPSHIGEVFTFQKAVYKSRPQGPSCSEKPDQIAQADKNTISDDETTAQTPLMIHRKTFG